MGARQCLISDCAAEAAAEFTVNDNAVCLVHLTAIRNGTMFAAPAEPTRGFLGLREGGDTLGDV